jgi:hypothetical protein
VVARGGLVVVDQGNQLIRFVSTNNPAYGVASSLAGVAGVSGSNNAIGTAATFNYPSGIAVDAAGNLYVADLGNNLIRKIDNSGSNVVTTVGNTNGYSFLEPTGVAVDNYGNLWVSDTGHHVICMISNQNVSVIAGISGTTGYSDPGPATNSLLDNPAGILWVGTNLLLITDTGNDVIRGLYMTNQYGSEYYALQTLAGIPGVAGTANGSPLVATFNAPVGLGVDPYDAGYYVVDRGITSGGNLRSFQIVAPLPTPQVPIFGYVTYVTNAQNVGVPTFNASTYYSFSAPATLAYEMGSNATAMFLFQGPTGSTNVSGPSNPNPFPNDITFTQVPDLTFTGYSEGPSGERSTNTTARFTFVTANPSISGTNAAAITLSNTTPGALMYATLDGSIPTSGTTAYTNNQTVDFPITSNVILSVIAEAPGYSNSSVVTYPLSFSNYLANTVSYQAPTFAMGGSTLAVPVYATMSTSAGVLESVEFRAEIAPTGTDPGPPVAVSLAALSFAPTDFYPLTGVTSTNTILDFTTYAEGNAEGVLIFNYTNAGLAVAGVGAVGLVEIPIPTNALSGETYTLSIIYPSGTANGNQASVPLVGATNTVTIIDGGYYNGQYLEYLAGDSSPVNGYNAGQFGSGSLDNADVNNAMYASVGIRVPPAFTDAYNAMEVWPEDSPNGNNTIEMQDWNVILLRSVGLDTNNYLRFRTNGAIVQVPTNWVPGMALQLDAYQGKNVSKLSGGSVPPGLVWFTQGSLSAATQTNAAPGSVVTIPVYANVASGNSLSGLQFRAIVTANGSAPAPGAATFTPASGVPNPTKLQGLAANDIACFWSMGSFSTALQNSSYLGTIKFQVPAGAQTGQSYAVHFSGVQGAPNMQTLYKLESFPGTVWVSSTALQPASITSDEWKIAFFGSYSNPLAADNVDADGDGSLNWQEYVAGTNPTNALSYLKFTSPALSVTTNGVHEVAINWLTAPGKTYVLESSTALKGAAWTAISTNLGDGNYYQSLQTNQSGNGRFYQLLVNP